MNAQWLPINLLLLLLRIKSHSISVYANDILDSPSKECLIFCVSKEGWLYFILYMYGINLYSKLILCQTQCSWKKNRPIPSTIHINNKTPKVSELNYDIDQKHENMSFDTSFEHPEKGNCMYSSIWVELISALREMFVCVCVCGFCKNNNNSNNHNALEIITMERIFCFIHVVIVWIVVSTHTIPFRFFLSFFCMF